MKMLFLMFGLVLLAGSGQAQDHCFKNCFERLAQSGKTGNEKNLEILKELVGCRAPQFEVWSVKGEKLNLNDLKGKVVVLHFWFTDCTPCIAELPALNQLWQEYRLQKVVFISFVRDETQDILDFVKDHPFNYHLVSGVYDLTNPYCLLAGWPMNVVLDKEGIVRDLFAGAPEGAKAETAAYYRMKPVIDQYLDR